MLVNYYVDLLIEKFIKKLLYCEKQFSSLSAAGNFQKKGAIYRLNHQCISTCLHLQLVDQQQRSIMSYSSLPASGMIRAGGVGAPAMKRGWLRKKSRSASVFKNWQTRYFVLSEGVIRYYVEQREEHPYGHGLKVSAD